MSAKFHPDALIVGGGVIGCIAAFEAVRLGLKAAIVEKRPYLGREISALNHSFIRSEENDAALLRVPEPFRKLFLMRVPGAAIVSEGFVRCSPAHGMLK